MQEKLLKIVRTLETDYEPYWQGGTRPIRLCFTDAAISPNWPARIGKRALVTDDFRRTHSALHQWLNEHCLALGFRRAFVEEVTSTRRLPI